MMLDGATVELEIAIPQFRYVCPHHAEVQRKLRPQGIYGRAQSGFDLDPNATGFFSRRTPSKSFAVALLFDP
jgi:hypothetical protein